MTAQKSGHILVVDDDPDVLTAAQLLLKRHFAQVQTEENPARITEHLTAAVWDVILLDMNFAMGANSGEEGLHWLGEIHKRQPTALVILMTAYGAVDTAVSAMKQGAIDFVLKPWQNERLLTTVQSALRLKAREEEVSYLRSREKEIQAPVPDSNLIGDSPAMKEIRELVRRVAPTDANVLILGENGTGKEVVAQELYKHSRRKHEVLVTVDLGAVTESLFESELFGHKRGAFTGADANRIGRFQAAAGGTLFLDEIGNLPLHLQGKLLTALEQREVVPVGANAPVSIDVRLVCATNRPLQEMVQQGSFREDLLYRINTLEIHLPPLRERPEDIPPLLQHFIGLYARKYSLAEPDISKATLKKIQDYAWPGNVRELGHAVERAMIMSQGDELEADALLLNNRPASLQEPDNGTTLNLEALERQAIEQALDQHAGNVSKTAKALGITRTSLYRRMEKYGL